MVALSGPLASISCEPGQARKGAAAAVDSGAGVWLDRAATMVPLKSRRQLRFAWHVDASRGKIPQTVSLISRILSP